MLSNCESSRNPPACEPGTHIVVDFEMGLLSEWLASGELHLQGLLEPMRQQIDQLFRCSQGDFPVSPLDGHVDEVPSEYDVIGMAFEKAHRELQRHRARRQGVRTVPERLRL